VLLDNIWKGEYQASDYRLKVFLRNIHEEVALRIFVTEIGYEYSSRMPFRNLLKNIPGE